MCGADVRARLCLLAKISNLKQAIKRGGFIRDGVPGREVTLCRPRDDPAVWSLGTGWLKEARTVKRHENHNKLCTLARQQLGAVAGPGLLVSKTESTM